MFLKSKILDLTQRAQKVHTEAVKIYNCNSMEPLKHEEIDFIANQLNVCFSKDFYQINKIFSYEYIGTFELSCFFINKSSGVVEYTKEYREHGLPHHYVMLSDMGDGGSILLETQDSPEKPSPVIWCDMFPDFFNICEGKPMEQNPTIWPSFTDFFEYLVEQEEAAIQKEIK